MIRIATTADCPDILDVMFSTAMSEESTWWRNTVDGLEGKLAEGGGFVDEMDGRIVGCVMWVVDDGLMTLRGLAVRPESESRGIGAALVAAVEEQASVDGFDTVLLAVSSSNLEVCPWYERLGYVRSDLPYAHGAPGRPAPAVFTKRVG